MATAELTTKTIVEAVTREKTRVVLDMSVEEAKYLLWWIDVHNRSGIQGPVTLALRKALRWL